ncbi:MAG: DedA family protein [Sulfurospirillum sp.]|nr:DedA family protein [Sulfurospirillum sp.]
MNFIALFFISLGSATLLIGGSEVFLLYLYTQDYNPLLLLLVATSGNTLGSVINYALGKYASVWALEKNYIKALHVEKSKAYFDRYGNLALLFSWAPIIGDPITFVAGILQYNFWKFLILVTLAKCARYAFLLYIFN